MCCVCGSIDLSDDPAILNYDAQKPPVEICDTCGQKLELLSMGCEKERLDAKAYFERKIPYIQNTGVSEYLKNILKNMMKQAEADTKQMEDDAEESTGVKVRHVSFWINGLRYLGWIWFWLCILAGFIAGCSLMDDNFFLGLCVWLGGGIISFFSTAGIMIYLDMARDLQQIRNIIRANEKRRKLKEKSND